eukprot:gnl/TRDRNA2_/TRDRNA2_190568_c0_seq1.p1 gnl/TRDRNA2_/TRDRNA2_190568_c0~~gnl/TRDRNA2_/TRDRNA2_190568_c0_seq1.p1  ORF type:complete len:300 (+),score=45.08 gnl/TRDRNA2_/TRDRNA2_190568_c0_seq1:77-976(+)
MDGQFRRIPVNVQDCLHIISVGRVSALDIHGGALVKSSSDGVGAQGPERFVMAMLNAKESWIDSQDSTSGTSSDFGDFTSDVDELSPGSCPGSGSGQKIMNAKEQDVATAIPLHPVEATSSDGILQMVTDFQHDPLVEEWCRILNLPVEGKPSSLSKAPEATKEIRMIVEGEGQKCIRQRSRSSVISATEATHRCRRSCPEELMRPASTTSAGTSPAHKSSSASVPPRPRRSSISESLGSDGESVWQGSTIKSEGAEMIAKGRTDCSPLIQLFDLLFAATGFVFLSQEALQELPQQPTH